MKIDTGSDHADAATEQSGWGPLDCLRSLGRAASIAAGAPSQNQSEFHGFRIATTEQDGAYEARVTHHQGKAIRLPALLRHQLEAARFKSAEEAAQHARFLVASGALRR